MKTRFASDGSTLLEVMREFDADGTVEGVGIFAADGSLPALERVDPVLTGLSTPVFGGVFPSIVHDGQQSDAGAVVTGLRIEPEVTVVGGLSDSGTAIGDHLPADVPQNGTAFVFLDAFATRIAEFVSSLFERYGVNCNYIGGGAGSLDMEQRPCLFTGDGVVEDAAVLATVDVETSVGVRHGWKEIAGPLRVTAAENRTFEELNGETAFDVYRRVIEEEAGESVTRESFFDVAKNYPMGLSRVDGEKVVRDPFDVTAEGGLVCFGNVPEGEFVHVLEGAPPSLVSAAGESYEQAADGVSGDTLFFDCISRVLYLDEAFERELDAIGSENTPVVGALTIGEIANDGHGHLEYYNKTAVTGVTDGL